MPHVYFLVHLLCVSSTRNGKFSEAWLSLSLLYSLWFTTPSLSLKLCFVLVFYSCPSDCRIMHMTAEAERDSQPPPRAPRPALAGATNANVSPLCSPTPRRRRRVGRGHVRHPRLVGSRGGEGSGLGLPHAASARISAGALRGCAAAGGGGAWRQAAQCRPSSTAGCITQQHTSGESMRTTRTQRISTLIIVYCYGRHNNSSVRITADLSSRDLIGNQPLPYCL